MMSTKTLIYIAGPTGVGKTKTSIALAKAFDTEIISCDSRQFYQEMQIGTAVPSKEELAAVKHHFIQSKSVNENYTVADFETEALQTVERLFKEKDTLIMVGGSGMYADAVMFGMDKFPEKLLKPFYSVSLIKDVELVSNLFRDLRIFIHSKHDCIGIHT